MKFKKLLFLFGVSVSCFSFSQNKISQNVELSPLTEVMIYKYYSADEIQELNQNKLNTMNYDFSKSFEIVTGQSYTQDQLLKIDVLNYYNLRKENENIIVFDNQSGLNIILYSLNKIKEDKKALGYYKNNTVSNSKNLKK